MCNGDANVRDELPPSSLRVSIRESGVSQSGVGSGGGTVAHAQRVALKERLRFAWQQETLGSANAGGEASQRAAVRSAPYEPCAEDYTIP